MTKSGIPTRFTDDRSEYTRSGSDDAYIYTAALFLPSRVKPLCTELQALADQATEVNVLNPLTSFRRLHRIRETFTALLPQSRIQYDDCLKRLAAPVEGASGLDSGWIQGFTSAAGTSAILELSSSLSSVSETLDRKSAYSLACFSLYISVVSLVATGIFGWLSVL